MSYRERRLYRSIEERKVGGVAAGMAEYFGTSVIFIRIAFIVSLFIGFGLPLYVLFWILTPRDPAGGYPNRNFARIFFYGALFLAGLFGAFFLAVVTGEFLAGFLFLLGLGGGMLGLSRGRREEREVVGAVGGKRFTEQIDPVAEESEARVAGVCARVAGVLGIDPVVVRVVTVILIPVTFPLVPILYAVAALVLPRSSGIFSR